MDFLDNIIFSCNNVTGGTIATITSKYIDPIFNPALGLPDVPSNMYLPSQRQQFCSCEDPEVIENSIQKHWFDITQKRIYQSGPNIFSDYSSNNVPYHLIYSYLTENTRIFQIFEKLLFMFGNDELLSKITDPVSFQWLVNTETLFFKTQANFSTKNITSFAKQDSESSRRNAYYRMFGMELAFGNSTDNGVYPFVKAGFSNSGFVALFERFLIDFWQAYINRTNTSGANTTDLESLVDVAEKLREMLFSRRTSNVNFLDYSHYNLSREEYSSVGLMSWLFNIISDNTNILRSLNCEGNSPGERLMRLGQKVGIPAHSKAKNLLDMAAPAAQFLRDVENGAYGNTSFINNILKGTQPFDILRDNLLTIINNWEKATNHPIKNSASKLTGTVNITNRLATFN